MMTGATPHLDRWQRSSGPALLLELRWASDLWARMNQHGGPRRQRGVLAACAEPDPLDDADVERAFALLTLAKNITDRVPRQVVAMAAEGASEDDIGRRMRISPDDVEEALKRGLDEIASKIELLELKEAA